MLQGDRLRRLRETAGWTQAEAATLLTAAGSSVNQAFLSQVERSEKNVSLETLVALARLYSVSTDYLLGQTDDPSSHMDSDEAAMLVEADPAQRAALQQVFAGVERLPDALRRDFYNALQLVYLGVMQRRKERSR